MPSQRKPRLGRLPTNLTLTRLLAVSLLAFLAHASESARGGELTMAEFRELHQQLQVPADTPWRTIPWKTAMLDAQRTAAQQAKPIFIWAMDGHPLGCT